MSGGGKFGFTGYASNGISPSATGPLNVSVATGSSGTYNNACYVYRSGTAATLAETGINFNGNTPTSSATVNIAASAFNGSRDRIIAFGGFARGTASPGGGSPLIYSWLLSEMIPFIGGSLNTDPYNQIQDTLIVVPGGGISVIGGVGPYVTMFAAPNVGDFGVFRLSCTVTDLNGSTLSAAVLNITINFT